MTFFHKPLIFIILCTLNVPFAGAHQKPEIEQSHSQSTTRSNVALVAGLVVGAGLGVLSNMVVNSICPENSEPIKLLLARCALSTGLGIAGWIPVKIISQKMDMPEAEPLFILGYSSLAPTYHLPQKISLQEMCKFLWPVFCLSTEMAALDNFSSHNNQIK